MGVINRLSNPKDFRTGTSAGADASAVTPPPEVTDTLAVGQVLEGKYRVERIVDEDRIAITLAATHLKLDELVTIKVLSRQARAIPDVRARFAREARTYARIRSEHAVQILDAGVLPQVGPYMVTEYLDGRDLAELLKQDGPLSAVRATELVLQACDAVAVAHASGVVHGDLQPSNLFIARRGNQQLRLKVLGFRVAKLGEEGGGASDGSSFEYLSPEQMREGATVDHRSDIWALGMVLYEMVTGRSGFGIDTFPEAGGGGPPRVRGLLPDAPVDLDRVISRCIARDPAARFQNVAELAAAVGPFAPGARTELYVERCTTTLRDAGFAMAVGGELKAKEPGVVPAPRVGADSASKIEVDPDLTAEAIAKRARHRLPPPSLAETAIAEAMQTQPGIKIPETIDFDLRPRQSGLKFFGGAARSFLAVVGVRWIVQRPPAPEPVEVAAPISARPHVGEAPAAKTAPAAPLPLPSATLEEHGLSTALDNEATRDGEQRGDDQAAKANAAKPVPVKPVPMKPAPPSWAGAPNNGDKYAPAPGHPFAKSPLPSRAPAVAVTPRMAHVTRGTAGPAAAPAPQLRRAAFIQRAEPATEVDEADLTPPPSPAENSSAPRRGRQLLLDNERQVQLLE